MHKNAGQFSLGVEGNFFIWENTLVPAAQSPYEGSESISLQSAPGLNWFGAAFTPNVKYNLTAFSPPNGKLRFSMKTSATTTFMIGMKSGNLDGVGQRWITFQAGSDPYGFVRDGQWHAVEIPMSDMAPDVDLLEVSQLFQVLGLNGAISNIQLDDIYFTGGGTLHTNVVAAEILDGVGISWPTLAGTNYAVQWTANLATNAVWNNLAAPYCGRRDNQLPVRPDRGFTAQVLPHPAVALREGQRCHDHVSRFTFHHRRSMTTKPLLAVGLVGLAMAVPAQVLNPGFELAGSSASSATNWTVTQAAGGPVYAVRTNNNPHGGSFNFEVRLASTGAGPVVEFAQAGCARHRGDSLSLYFLRERADRQPGLQHPVASSLECGGRYRLSDLQPRQQYLRLRQQLAHRSAGSNVGHHLLPFRRRGHPQPVGYHSARRRFTELHQRGERWANTNRILASITRGTGIRWFASNSVTYQVQWSSALLGTNTVWNNLGSPIAGNGATNTVFDPVGPPHNFFQVLAIQ